MKRLFNFYAGPATLPLPVLERAEKEFLDYRNMGMSLMETSHRSKEYDEVHNAAGEGIRKLLKVPENYSIIFLGGGATLQFSMVPMNFMGPDGSCDLVLSGAWAQKALDDVRKFGTVNVVWDGKSTEYSTLPSVDSLSSSAGSSYFHITSNETIGGVQWQEWPTVEAPLIADMSSDILSRPVPIDRFGMIYAGAQKNLGPAGVTIAIIRDDLVARSPDILGAYLSYKTHVKKNSLYNTPPVFSIYMVKLVLEWLEETGGVEAMQNRNEYKATLLYNAIEESDGFYRSPVDPMIRSRMNVVFRLPSEELEATFVSEAKAGRMVGLKGHRSVGGIRASIYNAMPTEGVEALVDLMKDFAVRNG